MVSPKEKDVTPAVIEACRRGDRDAFGALYSSYRTRVYSMALYYYGGDRDRAADLTQQVFLKLMERIASFDERAEFATWLHRFVVNACVDGTRTKWRRMHAVDPATFDAEPSPNQIEDELAARERVAAVQAALASLTPVLRIAIVLRYFSGLSYTQMAQVLDCSIGTVASRLSRGHQLLADKLADFAASPSAGVRR